MIDKKKIQRFEDMEVWQDAQDLAVNIYQLTKAFPKDELYGITNQVRRAASSISANIAEGFGRKSAKDKLQFYRVAYGSLLEVKNFIYLSRRLGYVDNDTERDIVVASEHLQKQINAIFAYFKDNA